MIRALTCQGSGEKKVDRPKTHCSMNGTGKYFHLMFDLKSCWRRDGAIFECSNYGIIYALVRIIESAPGEVGVGGGAGELVVEERSVDFADDDLVAHGAVGHHAEGVVDDAAVAGPGQLRGRPTCKIRECEFLVGYRQTDVGQDVSASVSVYLLLGNKKL